MKYLPNTLLLRLKRAFRKEEVVEDITTEPAPMMTNYKLLNRKEQAKLITDRLMSLDISADDRRNAARELKALKSQHKVSWEKLGVTEDHERMVDVLLINEPKPVRVSKKTKALSQAFHANQEQTASKQLVNDCIRLQRDAEILRLHKLGFSLSNIAHRLNISRDTVSRAIKA